MSSWSRVHNPESKKVDFLWRGQSIGCLSSSLARFWEAPAIESVDFEQALLAFQAACEAAGYRWSVARLAQQNQSKKQLTQKLKERGMPIEGISSVLQRLEKAGFLDEAFLAQSLEERELRAHKSRRAVEQKLSLKGLKISKINYQDHGEQEIENAYYWLKKWAKTQDLSQRPDRYMARLASRGFDFSTAQQAWQRLMKDLQT